MKLEYLKTQCEGAAYQAIAGLELSDSNYEVAIDILKGRFGQRQVILNSHIDALMKINALHKITDVSEVRRFYDTVEIHCRGLQSLGVDPKTYGTVLMNLLLQKLPEEIQLIISRKLSELHGDEDWELPKLLEILKIEIEAREKCSAGKTVPKRSGMSGHATAAALTAANTGKTNCTFYKGNHNTVECHVVTDVQERKKILRNTGRCFLCLRKAGHLERDCDACIKCFHCRGHHHVALCHKHVQFGGREKQKADKKVMVDENDKGRNKSSSHTTESYFDEINEEIEQYSLHAFGDASKKAFCSVIYLVMKIVSGYHCKLVTSKSRVVPLKEMSVPRLELIAVLILARLLNNVKHSLESQILFESIYCWSDSTIVLSWLKHDRNYKQFVSNRTKNILKLTSPEMWNHCSTEDNPADIGTRGKSAAELKNSSLWWAGPEWLKGSPESHPLQLAPQELESDECLKEVCKEQITLQVIISANKFNHIHLNLDEVISVDRYSSLCYALYTI